MSDPTWLSRRALLAALAGAGLPAIACAQTPAADHGRVVPPFPLPAFELHRHDGKLTTLTTATRGRATALHLMFTRCRSTCPIQAAIFQSVQSLLGEESSPHAQLISLSIDPRYDTAEVLTRWLEQNDAGRRWIALRPEPAELPAINRLFGGTGNRADTHSTQVSIIDRDSRLIWRSIELPAPEQIASLLEQL